jgi:hypothetical protein
MSVVGRDAPTRFDRSGQAGNGPFGQRVIPKSGHRFSEKITRRD